MKIFVATREGQGARSSDFFDAAIEEGEILISGMECDRDHNNPDGNCGCQRGLQGLDTAGATTTFTIVDLPISSEWYREQIIKFWASKGWFELNDEAAVALFREDARDMLDIASEIKSGVVLEKRGDMIRVREPLIKTQMSETALERLKTSLNRAKEMVH